MEGPRQNNKSLGPESNGREFEQEKGGCPASLGVQPLPAGALTVLGPTGLERGPCWPACGVCLTADAKVLQTGCPTFARAHQMQTSLPHSLLPALVLRAALGQMASRQAGRSPLCPGLFWASVEAGPLC